jgi:hypothetical protein
MKLLNNLVSEALTDFQTVVALAHSDFKSVEIKIEILARPHLAPKSLPIGQAAVYAFIFNDQALKIGMVGPRSQARYTSQHYNPMSSGSNLAKSILESPKMLCDNNNNIDPQSVGDWITKNTDRVNFLFPISTNLLLPKLLEAFLHVQWNPVFEGHSKNLPNL